MNEAGMRMKYGYRMSIVGIGIGDSGDERIDLQDGLGAAAAAVGRIVPGGDSGAAAYG